VPGRWVVADCLYGRAHHFRGWLEEHGRAYVVRVLPAQVVVHAGRRQRAKALAEGLPATAWVRPSAGAGCQGERIHDWACVGLLEDAPDGMGRWLLVRRPLESPEDCAYFRAYGPAETTTAALVRVAGTRWAVEEGFAQAKGEVGLDQYEVRRWAAWHRHITLGLLAHAYLLPGPYRLVTEDESAFQEHLRQVTQAQRLAQPPEHHQEDTVRGHAQIIERGAAPCIETPPADDAAAGPVTQARLLALLVGRGSAVWAGQGTPRRRSVFARA
jgi:hypothetical protein